MQTTTAEKRRYIFYMEDGSRSGIFSRLFRSKKGTQVEEEIVSMLEESQDQGLIKESEAEMISNIFDLDETSASEIMTHRKNIRAVESTWTLQETMDFITKEQYSRFPVCHENIDNIIGILHIKDAITYYMDPANRDKQILEIDGIMLDRKFMKNKLEYKDKIVISSIVAMANKLNLEVFCEGVENEEQRNFLIKNECPYMQGNLFSRPVDEKEFEKLLV